MIIISTTCIWIEWTILANYELTLVGHFQMNGYCQREET